MSKECQILHQWFNSMHKMKFPFEKERIPLNGIYVLFERKETAHGTNRIVRIGTHTGEDQLPSRLMQHFVKENKDRSIFRKNIGRAILNKEKDAFLEKWELDLTSKESKDRVSNNIDFEKQEEVERRVTRYIQDNFTFVVFEVGDKKERLRLESKIISTISLCQECRPSRNWLGSYSPKEKIRESGMWLVNELNKEPLSDVDMKELKQMLKVMI